MGADKCDADEWFAAQSSEFYLDGLKKLKQQSKKCVELRGECIEKSICVKIEACCHFYKAKDSSASPHKRDEIIHVGCYTTKDFVIYKNNLVF